MTELGTVLDGKYEILKKVGQGGMSIVYLAMDNRLNKQWAVKEIKNDGSKSVETLLKGLEREANILKNVDHPVLPRIVDIINENGTIYVIMDFVEGKPLNEVLKAEGAQKQSDVIEWGRALASALDYLHSMNPPIIYRDMKPSNVMLKPDGSVKLIDFGTAKEYIIENNADTTALGTRGYAAPEQFGDAQGRLLYYVYNERLQEKTVLAYRINAAGRQALAEGVLAKRAKGQHAALGVLAQAAGALSVSELAQQGVSSAVARALAQNGLADAVQKRVLRNSYNTVQERGESLQLTAEQQDAAAKINQAIDVQRAQSFLLQGITGSGKTTTLYAMLNELSPAKIFTLEDPIEIYSDRFIQIQINERQHLGYDEGISQLLRHDPDVIMIGEIREPVAAAMALRCGKWKYIEFYEDHSVRLFDLEQDVSEKHNVAEANPDLVRQFHSLLHEWLEAVDAWYPEVNPNAEQDMA